MILYFYVNKTPLLYIIRHLMIYISWRCGPICGVLLSMLHLQIIHLFILHYDSATKNQVLAETVSHRHLGLTFHRF